MSAEIIEFQVNATRTIPEIPRKRVFYLGPHGYSAGLGLSWCTEYWVKRIQRGAAWEIYCTNPEETGRQRVWMGEYSPESLREYFDDVGLPKEVEHWSLTTLREKLVKIGAKVVRHGRYVTFQLAEVTVSKSLFQKILALIDDLRRSPVPA